MSVLHFKYLKISQDLKKYTEEYAVCICNTSYLYSAFTPICQSALNAQCCKFATSLQIVLLQKTLFQV